jgi:hypothetical protein
MTSNTDWTSFENIIANWTPSVEVKAEVEKTPEPIKVNDILVAQWGYDANNVEFFKVLRRTAKFIEIAELNVENLPGDTGIYMGVNVIPGTTWKNYSLWADRESYNLNRREDGAPIKFRKKIKVSSSGREYIDLADYANAPCAFLWDGKPKTDYNHH